MRTQLFFLFLFISYTLSFAPEDSAVDKLVDTITYSNPKCVFDDSTLVVDKEEVKFDTKVTSKQVLDEMGFGWNLGNTFDAFTGKKQNEGLESETCWGVSKTTEEIIEGLYTKGIRTIRIPVTWHNHLIDKSYTIDPDWMKRVKKVVDWSIDKGLYVILNTHHDNAEFSVDPIEYGKGYYPLRKDLDESTAFLFNVWTQISAAFNNGYDHHLIFEGLNEPRPMGTGCEWTYKKGDPICEESASVLNEFNRIILKAVRESGGNNEKRFFMVTPLAAAYGAAVTSDFIFPGDSKYNPTNPKILLSVHMYLPYNFAMNADMSFTKFEEAYKNEVVGDFKTLYENFVLKGHHVVIGEMGTVNKNNTEDRIEWAKMFIENSRKYQMCACLWDNEVFDNRKSAAEIFGSYHRKDNKWENDDIIDTYVEYASTEFIDSPREEFKPSLIETPMEFNDWSLNYQLGMGVFSSFNSYSHLCFTTEDPESFEPEYRSMILFLGDWSDKLNITKEEMEGADFYELGSISIKKGKNKVKITLNEKNMKLAKERGLIIIGYGFTVSKIFVSGPKLAGFEPMKLTRSKEEKQTVKFYFSENATIFEDKIKFVNNYYDLNKKVKCKLSEKNETIIECKGLFDFTGEYRVADDKGVFLSSLSINVVPEKGEKYDINNLLESKVNLDDFRMLLTLHFPSSVLSDVKKDSILVIETDDYYLEPSYRTMFLFKGETLNVLRFNSSDVNTKIGSDGGFVIPKGPNEVRMKLTGVYKELLDKGFTLKGYGFSVKSVYVDTTVKEKEEEKEKEDEKEKEKEEEKEKEKEKEKDKGKEKEKEKEKEEE